MSKSKKGAVKESALAQYFKLLGYFHVVLVWLFGEARSGEHLNEILAWLPPRVQVLQEHFALVRRAWQESHQPAPANARKHSQLTQKAVEKFANAFLVIDLWKIKDFLLGLANYYGRAVTGAHPLVQWKESGERGKTDVVHLFTSRNRYEYHDFRTTIAGVVATCSFYIVIPNRPWVQGQFAQWIAAIQRFEMHVSVQSDVLTGVNTPVLQKLPCDGVREFYGGSIHEGKISYGAVRFLFYVPVSDALRQSIVEGLTGWGDVGPGNYFRRSSRLTEDTFRIVQDHIRSRGIEIGEITPPSN